jgi:hypothetical protein
MNWASGQSPSGNNVHPTSVGNMDIGDSGRRNVANSRMTDLMRNRSWTNPSPRPRVRPERGPGNPGPAKKPNIQPAPLPSQNYKPKDKPKDWGSDNNAQLISGGIPQKSAWDEEAYYEYDYDFDMKKLPIQGSSPKPYKASGPSADARAGASVAKDRAGLAAAGRYFGDPQKGKERIRSFGNTAIGAAGSASGAPMGDNRNGTIRPNRGAGNPGRPAPRPVRGPGKAAPTSFGDYLRGNDLGQSKGRSAAVGRRGASIRQAAYDIAGSEGPKRGPSSVDRPQQQKPMAFNQAVPRQDKPSQGSLGKFGKPKTWSGSPGAGGPRQSVNPNIRSFAGKSYDEGYEYDEYDEYLYQKSYDQGYDEYDEYDEYIDFKGMTDEQAAGLRAAGNYFSGRNVGGSSFGSADTMASRGAVRRSAALQNFGSEGPKRGAPSKPRPAMRNTPNRTRPGNVSPGAGGPRGPRPGAKPASSGGGGGGFYGESLSSRWDRWTGKGSDEEMYWDDEDEMAIPPDTDDKAANPGSYEQAAGRERFRQFGDHLNATDVAKGPQRDAESAKRKAGLSKYVAGYSSAMGTAQTYGGNRSASKPRPIRGPGNTGAPKPPRPIRGPGNPGRTTNAPRPGTPNPRRYV